MGDPERFARILQSRRRELGMSQRDVRKAGGPSDLTLRRLEHGDTSNPDFVTLGKLDDPLEWTQGSAARAFQGGEPTPLRPSHKSGRGDHVPELPLAGQRPHNAVVGLAHGVFVRTDALADLTRKVKVLDDIEPSASDPLGIQELRWAIDRLIRAWIIRQAETARREGTLADLILVLDDHLRSPPTTGTPKDNEDLRYLRWLAGYDVNVAPPEAARFRQRYIDSDQEY